MKTNNEQIYERLMRSRENDPKGYFLRSVGLKYDEVHSARKSGNDALLNERLERLSDYIQEYAPMYDITMNDIKEHFKKMFFDYVSMYHYSLSISYRRGKLDKCRKQVSNLSVYIKDYALLYGITAPEVKQYFVNNNMSLNFKL